MLYKTLFVSATMVILGVNGSAADESGHPAAAADQRTELSAQVTLGGAKSPVIGPIARIEGDYYFVHDDELGHAVRLVVDRDSNLICGAPARAARVERVLSDREPEQAAGSTARQQAQGQRADDRAVGSGFVAGDCGFRVGDRIKAEVSDLGTVTTLKLLGTEQPTPAGGGRAFGESGMSGELGMPISGPRMPKQDKPGQLDMVGREGDYAVLPVPQGSLQEAPGEFPPISIVDPDGRTLGTLSQVIADAGSGRIAYVIIRWASTGALVPVPWDDLKPDQELDVLVFTASQYQIEPEGTAAAVVDSSPPIEESVDLQATLAPPDLQSPRVAVDPRGAAAPEAPQPLCQNCTVVRVDVVSVDSQSLVVKNHLQSEREVRIRLDEGTQWGQVPIRTGGEFRIGDTIEAYVAPEGRAAAISVTREAAHMALPDN